MIFLKEDTTKLAVDRAGELVSVLLLSLQCSLNIGTYMLRKNLFYVEQDFLVFIIGDKISYDLSDPLLKLEFQKICKPLQYNRVFLQGIL